MPAEVLYLNDVGDSADLTLTAVYGATSRDKWKKPQIVVQGTKPGAGGLFRVYAPEKVLTDMVKLGLVERPGGTDQQGEEVLKLTTPGARVVLERVDIGRKYAGWGVRYVGGAPIGGPVSRDPEAAAAPARTSAPRGGSGQASRPNATPEEIEEQRRREELKIRRYWTALQRTGKGCLDIALRLSGFTLRAPEKATLVDAHIYRAQLEFLHSLAASLFIQARRDGQLVPPATNGKAKEKAGAPAGSAGPTPAPATPPAPTPASAPSPSPVHRGDAYEEDLDEEPDEFPEASEEEDDDLFRSTGGRV